LAVAQIEVEVLHSLDHLGEHLDSRAAAVPVPHVSSGPAEYSVDHLAGRVQSIGERVPERMKALMITLGPGPVEEPVRPALEIT
jgi:hypothetical protein